MGNKVRKIIPAILAFALIFCSLSGCSSNQEKPSDTILWINATHAILTESNGDDYRIFGGVKPSETNQQILINTLSEWWGVTDRQSAIENMDWLLNDGHRFDFVDFMGMLKEEGAEEFTQDELTEVLSMMMEDETEGAYLAKTFSDYITYGEHAMDGTIPGPCRCWAGTILPVIILKKRRWIRRWSLARSSKASFPPGMSSWTVTSAAMSIGATRAAMRAAVSMKI